MGRKINGDFYSQETLSQETLTLQCLNCILTKKQPSEMKDGKMDRFEKRYGDAAHSCHEEGDG
jgi:hypothetical protein